MHGGQVLSAQDDIEMTPLLMSLRKTPATKKKPLTLDEVIDAKIAPRTCNGVGLNEGRGFSLPLPVASMWLVRACNLAWWRCSVDEGAVHSR